MNVTSWVAELTKKLGSFATKYEVEVSQHTKWKPLCSHYKYRFTSNLSCIQGLQTGKYYTPCLPRLSCKALCFGFVPQERCLEAKGVLSIYFSTESSNLLTYMKQIYTDSHWSLEPQMSQQLMLRHILKKPERKLQVTKVLWGSITRRANPTKTWRQTLLLSDISLAPVTRYS
jgi:hypothetical protein